MDDDGQRQTIDSADVNAYLREIFGAEFTAKDFRTWGGTVLAAVALRGRDPGSPTRARKHITQAVAAVHPAVLEAFQEAALGPPVTIVGRPRAGPRFALQPDERVVLRLLERRRPVR